VPALRASAATGCYFPGPSTPAEGVPALRAYVATGCYFPGPSTPAEGVPALRAYEPQDATFRGLRPRQRMCQPFGPMSHKMLLSGAFDPSRGCAGPSGLCGHKIATYRGLRPRLSSGGHIRSLDHCASERRFVGTESKSGAIRPIQPVCKLHVGGCVRSYWGP
jgi:hypothetical protein